MNTPKKFDINHFELKQDLHTMLKKHTPPRSWTIGLLVLVFLSSIPIVACEKEDVELSPTKTLQLKTEGEESNSGESTFTPSPWLRISTFQEYVDILTKLEKSVSEPGSPESNEQLPDFYTDMTNSIGGFKSYSHYIYEQEDAKLNLGWETGDVVADDHYADKHEGLLLNEDGILQIGDTMIWVTPNVTYRTVSSRLEQLIDVATEASPNTDGIVLEPRTDVNCSGVATAIVNHQNRVATIAWNGNVDPETNSDAELLWTVSGQPAGTNYRNQT